MEKRWLVKTPKPGTVLDEFRSTLKVDPIVAELLLQRGIEDYTTAERFFRPSLEELHDPFLMADMEAAVDRLQSAIDEQERVLLFGDYDVDGTTAVALMYTFLKNTLPVEFYIPDRYKEGYGLSNEGIDLAAEHGVQLLITLDCGIKSVEKIAYARSMGIDVIVCDHHTPGEQLPDGIILDPKRSDCTYPYKELSGCGVGFKLLQALSEHNGWSLDPLFDLLDLVAVSIGADIVPVTGENRVLCYHGMELLNSRPRVAFKEMMDLAKREFPVTLTDVVFTIAPRINAVGRLRSGSYAVQLMISENNDEIRQLAHELNDDNLERRELDQQITAQAIEMLEADDYHNERVTTIAYHPDWHKGVVGIVASRLVEKWYRPSIVLTQNDGKITGSARSVEGFDIHAALVECQDLLEQFGGHMHAAGLTLLPENLEAFKEQFDSIVRKRIDPALLTESQEIDLELDFDQIFKTGEDRMKIPKLKRILRQFEPHGPGNMKPVFLTKNVFSTQVRLLKDAHLKLSMVQPEHDVVMEGIGFNMHEKQDSVSSGIPFDVVYTLEINRWNGRETLQLNIKDVRETI